jgi:hypothetical protein
MTEADVVVSAFATPSSAAQRAIAQDTTFMVGDVVVLGVDPIMKEGEILASAGFKRAADQLRDPASKSILGPLFARRLSGYTPRSVTLVGFSAGNNFLYHVLNGPDLEWVDGVIALDGMVGQKLWDGSWHMPSLNPWIKFAKKAAYDERLFVCSFTNIASHSKQVGSTKATAEFVMDVLSDQVFGTIKNPSYDLSNLVKGPPPPEVTITVNRPVQQSDGTVKNVPITKTWSEMPTPQIQAIGNAWNLDYGGNVEPDHVFQAVYVQRAIWRTMLAARLNSDLRCRIPDLAGLGATTCVPNKVLVPEGVFPTHSALASVGAAIAGLALGGAVGYWATNKLGR